MKNLSKLKNLGIFVSILYFSLIILSVKFADISPLDVTKDNPIINNGESIFRGIISNIGIFLWFLSGSLNTYAYVTNQKNKIKNIFFIGAINSGFLLIADFFDLQNHFQNIVYFFLIISAFFVFFYCKKFLLIKNKLIIIFFSFSFLAAGMLIDILQSNKSFDMIFPYFYSAITEELFEFLGGFYYLFYWIEVFRINKQNKKD